MALAGDPEAVCCNPAGLAQVPSAEASFSYSYPFGAEELGLGSACLAISSKAGCFTGALISYGFELYREDTVSLAYARPVTPHMALGLALKGDRLAIEGFGVAYALALDLGLLARITERFEWGMAAWNVLGTKIGGESLGQDLTVGAAFRPQEHVTFYVDARKDLKHALQVLCGAEYGIADGVTVRVGAGQSPSTFSAGVGARREHWRLEYAVSSHLVLGLSHCISMVIL